MMKIKPRLSPDEIRSKVSQLKQVAEGTINPTKTVGKEAGKTVAESGKKAVETAQGAGKELIKDTVSISKNAIQALIGSGDDTQVTEASNEKKSDKKVVGNESSKELNESKDSIKKSAIEAKDSKQINNTKETTKIDQTVEKNQQSQDSSLAVHQKNPKDKGQIPETMSDVKKNDPNDPATFKKLQDALSMGMVNFSGKEKEILQKILAQKPSPTTNPSGKEVQS